MAEIWIAFIFCDSRLWTLHEVEMYCINFDQSEGNFALNYSH